MKDFTAVSRKLARYLLLNTSPQRHKGHKGVIPATCLRAGLTASELAQAGTHRQKAGIQMLILCVLCASVAILPGCGREKEVGRNESVLRIGGLGGQPGPINQIISNGTISVNLADLVYSPLVRINARMLPEPALAERWEVSPDGLSYTFYLRKGVKFHDGTELTAQDCAFTYNAVLNPATKSPWRDNYIMIKNVRAEDNWTFTVTLKEPQASFINLMNFPIHPHTKPACAGEPHADRGLDVGVNPIGTGPFRFKARSNTPRPFGTPLSPLGRDFAVATQEGDLSEVPSNKRGFRGVSNDTIILERNPDYYEGRPQIDRIIATGYDSFSEYFSAFMKGQIDFIQFLSPEQYATISRDPAFRTYRFPSIYTYMIDYNPEHPLFKDQRVRRALAQAINIPEIINKMEGISYSPLEKGVGGLSSPEDGNNNPLNPPLLRGNIYQSTGPFLPNAWFSNPEVKPLEYNPAEALRLLKEAGWQLNSNGILETPSPLPTAPAGQAGFPLPAPHPSSPQRGEEKGEGERIGEGPNPIPFRFTLLVDPRERTTEQIARLVYQDLYKIGVRCEIKTYDHFNQDKELVKNAGAAVVSFMILPKLEPSWHSDKQQQIGKLWRFTNPEIDALFEQADRTPDLPERTRIYHRLHRLVYADQSGTFLYNHPNLAAINNRFGNVEMFFTAALPFYTIKDWEIHHKEYKEEHESHELNESHE